jgi:hypothetical protein
VLQSSLGTNPILVAHLSVAATMPIGQGVFKILTQKPNQAGPAGQDYRELRQISAVMYGTLAQPVGGVKQVTIELNTVGDGTTGSGMPGPARMMGISDSGAFELFTTIYQKLW